MQVVKSCTNKEGEHSRSCEPSQYGIVLIKTSLTLPNTVAPMDHRPIPKIQFRVLIIGRENAGKTSILQRVCDIMESPVIYQGKGRYREEVFGPTLLSATLISLPTRSNLTRP